MIDFVDASCNIPYSPKSEFIHRPYSEEQLEAYAPIKNHSIDGDTPGQESGYVNGMDSAHYDSQPRDAPSSLHSLEAASSYVNLTDLDFNEFS